ncbi:MAG TPA: sugar phosphate isomerase/epimerase family protein [Devosiaceae bacterium]
MKRKLGVHLALWTRNWADDVVPYARIAAELGYDGVELSLLGRARHAPEETGKAIADLGLGVTATTGLSRATDLASPDPDTRAAGLHELRQAIEATHRLGADRLCGVVYGAWGVTDGPHRAERFERAVEGLAEASRLAEERGVSLGVEAINRFETDLVNTAQQALKMVSAVGSPALGVLLDSFHMNIEEEDAPDAIRLAGPKLLHFHVSDNDRGVPGGGPIDFTAEARMLDEIGYTGWVTAEMFIAAGVDVSSDLAIWRPIEQDPTEAARRTLTFLRETF